MSEEALAALSPEDKAVLNIPGLPLALIIHGTSGWSVSMDGLGSGVALAG